MGVKRSDLVTVTLQGAYGRPRLGLVIQSNLFAEHPSVTFLPLTSELVDAPLIRIRVEPSAKNGLQKPSQIMIDKHPLFRGRKSVNLSAISSMKRCWPPRER